MLRNHRQYEQYLRHLVPLIQQQRLIQQQTTALYNKNTNVIRQGKIMGKLFGQRISGSKKRWIPSNADASPAAGSNVLFNQSQFGKKPSGGDKNSSRRMTVLNKLFMKHITDLMATGEISENILGKGLQVSRVKMSPDFAYVNVFWVAHGEVEKDVILEQELQRCSGLLRHELSQLDLMGVVPRIKFVKDKFFANLYHVESLLRTMDFGPTEEEKQDLDAIPKHEADVLKQEFFGSKIENITAQKQDELDENHDTIKTSVVNVPAMRHDVLGLDHKGIMLKILTKMRKSKQAWDQHLQRSPSELDASNSFSSNQTIPSTTFSQLVKINEKTASVAKNSEKFEAFLAKRREKRNTPERKKFRASHHYIDGDIVKEDDYPESVLSKRQRQIFEAEDYLCDEKTEKS